MHKHALWIVLLCLSAAGCTNLTAPVTTVTIIEHHRIILHGIVVNGSDSTVVAPQINGTVLCDSLAPGASIAVDLGIGVSVFYAAWTETDLFKRSFSRDLQNNGRVSVDQFQQYNFIWIIGRGFWNPNNTTVDPAEY